MLLLFFFFCSFLLFIVVVVDHRNSRVQAHKHWRCLRRLALIAEGRDSAETSRPWKLMTNLHGIEGVVGLMVIWVYGEPEIHGIYIQCPEGVKKSWAQRLISATICVGKFVGGNGVSPSLVLPHQYFTLLDQIRMIYGTLA